MEEGRNKTIPLRRPRTARPRLSAVRRATWLDGVKSGVQALVLLPPRQLWLAGLGGTSLTLRLGREAWARMVAEGSRLEGRLFGTRRAPAP
jgi:hypothetical protein